MATIYEKISQIQGVDKTVILEPREALVYPIDFGDWNELRLTYAASFTSSTGDNSEIRREKLAGLPNLKNSLLVGLKSGDIFNQNSDYRFLGFGNPTGVSVAIAFTDFFNTNKAGVTFGYTGDSMTFSEPGRRYSPSGISVSPNKFITSGYSDIFVASAKQDSFYSFSTNNNNWGVFITSGDYSMIHSLRFSAVNKNLSGQSFNLFWSSNSEARTGDTRLSVLRTQNSIQTPNWFTGFYYNSDLSSTGSPISLPQDLIFYNPFINHRLRIHSFVIEKYS
jgi:hypothetical protein